MCQNLAGVECGEKYKINKLTKVQDANIKYKMQKYVQW